MIEQTSYKQQKTTCWERRNCKCYNLSWKNENKRIEIICFHRKVYIFYGHTSNIYLIFKAKIIVRNELTKNGESIPFFKAFQLTLSCRLFKSLKPTLPSAKTFHVNCYKYHSI